MGRKEPNLKPPLDIKPPAPPSPPVKERNFVGENTKLRELLWLRHGCPISALYGDDGEKQCNNTTEHRPIDFKRDDVNNIELKLTKIPNDILKLMKEYMPE